MPITYLNPLDAGRPIEDGFAITPHDTNDLPQEIRSIYVGSGGDLTVRTIRGAQISFSGLGDGALVPVRADRVLATGTTATNLIGITI